MTVLTPSAALAIAMQCVTPYSMATVAVGIAQHESGLETQTVHRNTNGTVDYGLAGINTINLGWLGLTPETALDPCKNLAASIKVLFKKYNGAPPPAVAKAYADDVTRRIVALDQGVTLTEVATPAPSPCQAVAWDAWARYACEVAHPKQQTGKTE